MRMKILLGSVLAGVAVTLLTGLIPNTPPDWLGATFYGYPIHWLTRLVLAPEYVPWRVEWTGLIGDLIVWVAIAGATLLALARLRR